MASGNAICNQRSGSVAVMWVAGLFFITSIAFLLMCLHCFQSALKERRYIWAILVKIEKEHAANVPRHKLRPEVFPKAA